MSLFGNNNAGGSGFGGGGFGANNNNQAGNPGSVFGSGGAFGQPAATGTFVLLAYLFLRSLAVNSSEGTLGLCCLKFFRRRDMIEARRDLHVMSDRAKGIMVVGDGDDDLQPALSEKKRNVN